MPKLRNGSKVDSSAGSLDCESVRLSCESQQEEIVHEWMTALDNKTQIDAILLDFAKAFDKVPHRRLLSKLTS